MFLWPALFTSFHLRIVRLVQPPPAGLRQCIVHCAALRASQGSLCSPHSDSCSTHPVRLKRGHIFPRIFENINLYSPTERFPCMQHCTVHALLQGPVISLLLLLLLLSCFSRVRLCATPWTAAHQAPPSLGFSRQEHWSRLPLPSPIPLLLYCNCSRFDVPCFQACLYTAAR